MKVLQAFWAVLPGSGARPDIMETLINTEKKETMKERGREGLRTFHMLSAPPLQNLIFPRT